MANEPQHEWFLEPLNDLTNEAIVRVLADECASDESCKVILRDSQGKPHDLWRVGYDTIAKFQRSRNSGYEFRSFVRKGGHGPIRPWPFKPDKKRRAVVTRGSVHPAG